MKIVRRMVGGAGRGPESAGPVLPHGHELAVGVDLDVGVGGRAGEGAGLPVGLGDGVGGRVVLDNGALDKTKIR